MKSTAQRFNVPPGFSGWWCARCDKEITGIPNDVDAAQLKCPKCHKWTVWWIPQGGVDSGELMVERPKRQPAGRALASEMAGAEWQRKMPKSEDAVRLFAHMREVIEHPETDPDLRKIEQQEYER